jgi:hypothetical protein
VASWAELKLRTRPSAGRAGKLFHVALQDSLGVREEAVKVRGSVVVDPTRTPLRHKRTGALALEANPAARALVVVVAADISSLAL